MLRPDSARVANAIFRVVATLPLAGLVHGALARPTVAPSTTHRAESRSAVSFKCSLQIGVRCPAAADGRSARPDGPGSTYTVPGECAASAERMRFDRDGDSRRTGSWSRGPKVRARCRGVTARFHERRPWNSSLRAPVLIPCRSLGSCLNAVIGLLCAPASDSGAFPLALTQGCRLRPNADTERRRSERVLGAAGKPGRLVHSTSRPRPYAGARRKASTPPGVSSAGRHRNQPRTFALMRRACWPRLASDL